jgi:hypothetical protein
MFEMQLASATILISRELGAFKVCCRFDSAKRRGIQGGTVKVVVEYYQFAISVDEMMDCLGGRTKKDSQKAR